MMIPERSAAQLQQQYKGARLCAPEGGWVGAPGRTQDALLHIVQQHRVVRPAIPRLDVLLTSGATAVFSFEAEEVVAARGRCGAFMTRKPALMQDARFCKLAQTAGHH